MKKISNLLLVRRPETKNKWWHRLALVLIYGSTIVITIFFAVRIISDGIENYLSVSYTAYSFEQGYENATGKEIDCKFSVFDSISDRVPPLTVFRCGDLTLKTEFLDRYAQARGTFEHLQEIRGDQSSTNENRPIKLDFSALEGNYIPVLGRPDFKTDNEIMVELIQSGELDNIKVKRERSFDYASFFGDWVIFSLLALGVWLIFWESIVYRTILFIAYGRSNKL